MSDLIGLSASSFGVPQPSYGAGAPISQEDWKKRVLLFLAHNTLPDWIDDELRERNRHVGYLDPDIACKRSWSLNVKIATQRERNIAKAKIDALEGPRRGLRSREFEEQFGVWI